ncbi:MAG: BON domain-containing protein [Phormidium sp. BM_Day4_Bin.17]|nr:BON domain-containing protein [Phormidium sp. BM_Day4_Bin.17]UCJ11544.1 MAG: BON domain-containing protein [Phormidium sp. PBR-2020]
MSWLSRIFGKDEEKKAQESPAMPIKEAVEKAGGKIAAAATGATSAEAAEKGEPIPPERVGLDGKYDQSGLAKRVVRAFDDNSETDDIETVWVAQLGTKVVLKGKVPSQKDLDRLVAIAKGVEGASDVDTSEVEVVS